MSSNVKPSEKMQFQTEVSQLLHLVIHSLYSNKEIFLRELVSNASDANDKLRFAAVENSNLYGDDPNLEITIDINKAENTITVSDNGIGMSKEEVIENIGTIAKSGTKEFLSKLTGDSAKDSNLIGQFGVGFYSAFIVADKVSIRTRKADLSANDAVMWESSGENSYKIESISKESRGTEIILHLKTEEQEFLSDYRLRSIISKYSDHIAWPIKMVKISTDDSDEKKSGTIEYEVINKAKAMWTLPKREISDKDYIEFYKHIAHDVVDPAIWSHNRVEGKTEYISLLYLPTKAPFDFGNREQKHGLHLYVKRIFIMDNADQFLPNYLRFVKGLIDSSDLPLNVSREILQSNATVNTLKSALTKKSLSLISNLSNNKEKYLEFWSEFGSILREGIVEDFSNKEEIAKLLRFKTTKSKSEKELFSFSEYLERIKDKQDKIYYLTAGSYSAAISSPHLELFNKKDIEVILFTDRIDEWVVNHLESFQDKKLQSISHGELNDNLLEEPNTQKDDDKLKSEIEKFTKALEGKVKAVKESKRLITSPACLVAEEGELSREMLKILEATGQPVPSTLPILEINFGHPLISNIAKENDQEKLNDWINLVFEQAVLAEGGALDEPGNFVNRLNKILTQLSS